MTFEPLSINKILYDYEQTRLANRREELRRREQIYREIPRIEELDTDSGSSYIQAVRERIKGKDTSLDLNQSTRKANRSNTAEKKRLLVEAGYPENYLDPIFTCELCKDTGYVDTKRCSCFMDKLIDGLYLQSNLNNILQVENFDTFKTDFYSKDKMEGFEFSPYDNIINILNRSKAFVEDFSKKDSHRGNILIYGEVGLGKTFLTNCIAKAILDRGHKVLYLSATELYQDILSPYLMNQENSLADLYKYVYNCDLLIIDDLGTEMINSFTKTNFFEIINQRIIRGKSTIISTNLELMDLKNKYTERIMSRIIAEYTVFQIYGENIRYQKRFKNTNTQN